MGKQIKMSDPQKVLIGKFYASVGWNPENAEAEKKELAAKIQALKEQTKSLEGQLVGFDGRIEKAAESLVLFGSMVPDAGEEEVLSFLYNRFRVKPKRAASADGNGPKVKATDEEKETILESLDREGRTVSEISKESGLDTKAAARILKAMIQDGTVTSHGERRGTRYELVAAETSDDDLDDDDEPAAK